MPDTTPHAGYENLPVVVTGGAGFIGSHLTEALVERGARVTVIDDLSEGRESNLDAVRDRIEFIRASILDEPAINDACAGAALVFHEAALTSVPRSVENPVETCRVNITGTMRVLEAARAAGVNRIVFAASSSAYGDSAELPKRESAGPDPLSPYAASKVTGELMLHSYCECFDIDGVSLRYFNIFGPRQRPDSPYAAVIPRFADAMLAGRKPTVYGDGTQTRDFTYISNAVQANLLAGVSKERLGGRILNIATGRAVSLLELLDAAARELGVAAEADFAPERPGDVKHSLADITRAREVLGYEPEVGFEEGLARTLGPSRGESGPTRRSASEPIG